jgi:hypothetical protein
MSLKRCVESFQIFYLRYWCLPWKIIKTIQHLFIFYKIYHTFMSNFRAVVPTCKQKRHQLWSIEVQFCDFFFELFTTIIKLIYWDLNSNMYYNWKFFRRITLFQLIVGGHVSVKILFCLDALYHMMSTITVDFSI